MAIPQVTPLPTAMSRQRPANYSAEGDTYFAALEQKMVPELNAMIPAMNTTAAAVDNQSVAALIAAQSAAASQASAALTANAGPWVSGTTYALNAAVISQVNFQLYRKRTNNSVSSTDPANDGTNWVAVGTAAMPRESRTSNLQLERTDSGKLIDITSGSFTQTFNTPAALSNGWFVYFRNSGTGSVVVNGTTTQQGWMGLIHSDGTSFVTTPLISPVGYMRVVGKNTGESSLPTGTYTFTRILNTVDENTINGASLSSNAVNLPAGSYRFRAFAPISTAITQLRFGEIVGAPVSSSNNTSTYPTVAGSFVIGSSQSFRLEQYAESLSGGTRFNMSSYMGGVVPITELEIWKVA